ncbi:hypothetical protein ONZ43_g6546 [Nemania bipapillata]|uniref:Uncharacterized protein n=1 Tax=Nemania bipapillata TaxID=110536 RepID=A0ACC2HYF2_9PEZI|nr:hypothetical protein ONZ43_g6546 [Nemania bipapillata]
MALDNATELMKEAKSVIETGLRILRGASGQCQYQAGYEGDPDPCFLSVREIGHTLAPVDQEHNLLKSYAYLTLDLKHVKAILRPNKDENCRIVAIIFSSVNLSNSAGAKLMIEFASTLEFIKLFRWISLYTNSSQPINMRYCTTSKLEKDFDEMTERAKSHTVITDRESPA